MASGNTFNANYNIGNIAGRTPTAVRGFIRNLAAYSANANVRDTLELAFRPNPVGHSINVRYEDSAPLGMSHSYMTYQSTDNEQWKFDVYQNALMRLKDIGQDRAAAEATAKNRQQFREGDRKGVKLVAQMLEEDRRFLLALSVPPAPAEGVLGTEPPACLLVIPGIVTQRVRLMSVDFTYTQSNIEGDLIEWKAAVTFREAPMGRITMEDVMTNGSFRSWGQ